MSEDAQIIAAIGFAVLLICFGCARCEQVAKDETKQPQHEK